MNFTKMQGAGNDFIIINNMIEQIPASAWSDLARRFCARRLSVGADGFMVVEKAENGGDYRMFFFNSDGSVGEMCGNGARCLARYGYENGLAGDIQRMETTAGMVIGRRCTETEYEVRLNDPTVLDPHRNVNVDGMTYDCGYVELGCPGLPHAILELPDWEEREESELRELGRKLRFAPPFPKGANVTFVKELEKDHFRVRTFERGVEDFTLACGTGCGSTVSVLTLRGRASGKNVRLDSDGGTLTISLNEDGGQITELLLRGPTCIVARGETVD